MKLRRGIVGEDGSCFVSYLEQQTARDGGGERWCPVLRRFLEAFNDLLPDGERQNLLGFEEVCIGALRNTEQTRSRVITASRWLIASHCAEWTREFGDPHIADELVRLTATSDLEDPLLGQWLTAVSRHTMALNSSRTEYFSAAAGVAARDLMQRSGAAAAAAALTPVLGWALSPDHPIRTTLRDGWHAWRAGWEICEAESQFALSRGDSERLKAKAEELRREAWRLFPRMVGIKATAGGGS